jgi:hypothetical protein
VGDQGAVGAQGPRGPQGAQGPAGTVGTQPAAFGVNTAAGPTGTLRATSTITAFYSDIRLKDQLETITNTEKLIQSIRGIYYRYNNTAKSHGYDSLDEQVGLLAQEVNAVIPEAVSPAPFDVDSLGSSKSGNNYLTIHYERILPVIIEELKRQQMLIEMLEAHYGQQ